MRPDGTDETAQPPRQSEAEFRAMFDLSGVGAAQADAWTGRFTRVNRRFRQITGYSERELLGMTFVDITHPADRQRDADTLARVLRGESDAWSIETRHVRKDGQVIWVSVNGTVLRDEAGRAVRSLAHVLDITQSKRTQEELEAAVRDRTTELARTVEQLQAEVQRRGLAEERLVELNAALQQQARQLRALALELTRTEQHQRRRLATILHDHLQQLMVGAKLGIETIEKHAPGDEVRRAAQHAADLVEECVRASHSLAVELSPPILHEEGLAAALGWLARWMGERHGLAVDVRSDGEVAPDPAGVCLLLFEAVRQLLLNVAEHAHAHSASVRMRRPAPDRVEIEVADRGAGFDPARLDAEGIQGGFGLFGIRERLSILGGRLELDTAPGKGTRVTLAAPLTHRPAPLAAAPAQAQPPGPAHAAHAARRGHKLRVLLVDDHMVLREGLARLLQQEPDMEIAGEAADGQQAVELARSLRPDLIIMDITMPRMNGIEATRIIKAEHPGIPVVGLSMHDGANRAAAMLEAGATAYLNKADPSQDLVATIRACCLAGRDEQGPPGL